jgi:adenylate kinase family enzyme
MVGAQRTGPGVIALIGLRGAGKTTIGKRLGRSSRPADSSG